MDTYSNVNSFFIGMTTAYYAIMSYRMFTSKGGGSARLKTVLAWSLVFWAINNTKDLMLTFPGMYCEKYLDLIIVIDGWTALPYMLFLFELTRPGWINAKNMAIAVSPFVAYTILYAIFPYHSTILLIMVFLVIYGLYITIIGYKRGVAYMNYIKSHYSNIDDIDITWLRKLFLLVAISLSSWLLTSLTATSLTDTLYYILSVAVCQLALHHCRKLKQVNVPGINNIVQDNSTEEEKPIRQEEKKFSFDGMPEKLIIEDRLFLCPNLTLDDLAKRLNTNRTYLSSYFSNVIRKTFYDYVNELRITQKSIPLIAECPDHTFERIAQESGFNSMSTFRRAFIKITGKTPSAYRDQL